MADTFRETATNYCSDPSLMSITSNERKWITKLRKLAATRPSDVRVVASPDTNDGYICCHLPREWLKISPPSKRTMTDEQRALLSDRMKKMHTSQKSSQ